MSTARRASPNGRTSSAPASSRFRSRCRRTAVAAIPSGAFANSQRPAATLASLKRDTSPVAELAAARHQDAIEMAMDQPVVLAKANATDMARQAQDQLQRSRDEVAANPPRLPPPAMSGAMQLASVDPNALPQAAVPQPAVMQISLPTHIAVLPPPAPGVPPLSPARAPASRRQDRDKAERCLANAVYFEARDQPYTRPGRGRAGGDEPRVLRLLSERRLRRDLSERPPPSGVPVHLRLRRQAQD